MQKTAHILFNGLLWTLSCKHLFRRLPPPPPPTPFNGLFRTRLIQMSPPPPPSLCFSTGLLLRNDTCISVPPTPTYLSSMDVCEQMTCEFLFPLSPTPTPLFSGLLWNDMWIYVSLPPSGSPSFQWTFAKKWHAHLCPRILLFSMDFWKKWHVNVCPPPLPTLFNLLLEEMTRECLFPPPHSFQWTFANKSQTNSSSSPFSVISIDLWRK